MRARVADVQVQAGKMKEASLIVEQSIVPVMKEQKGFMGQLFFTQEDTGKAISINLWETEADLKAFEGSLIYRELLGKLGAVLAGRPTGEGYDVSVRVYRD